MPPPCSELTAVTGSAPPLKKVSAISQRGVHEGLLVGDEQGRQGLATRLRLPGIRVRTDSRLNTLIGGVVLVLPYRHHPMVLGLPPADQPGTVPHLHRQQILMEELMEDREVGLHRLVD